MRDRPPRVGIRPESRSKPIWDTLAMLSRPDGATVEEVATALDCAIGRARKLVEHINLFLGHGIVVDADGVVRATPPLGSACTAT